VNAAIQLASRGMLPIGALAGGFLGARIGITNTIWISTAGALASALWLVPVVRSNVRPER
jgi:predicted MFS family arabinose efflux permease